MTMSSSRIARVILGIVFLGLLAAPLVHQAVVGAAHGGEIKR